MEIKAPSSLSLSIPEWQTSVFRGVVERNKREVEPFREIFAQYQQLMKKNQELTSKCDGLDAEVTRLSLSNSELQKKSQLPKLTTDQEIDPRIVILELEKKLSKAQEDLTLSYQRNSEVAGALSSFTHQMSDLKEELRHTKNELEATKIRYNDMEEAKIKLDEELKDKMVTYKIIESELKVIQVDYLHSEDSNKKIKRENDELIERWLKHKNTEAEKLNQVTDLEGQLAEAWRKIKKLEEQQKNIPEKPAPVIDMDEAPLLGKLDMSAVPIVHVPKKAKKVIEAHKGEVYSIAWSPTGGLMASGGGDSVVKLWDPVSGAPKATLTGASQSITHVVFSPGDDTVLGTSYDNRARVWGVQLGRIKHTLTGHSAKVMCGSFVGESSKVLTGSHDRTIKLWDLNKGFCSKTMFCFSSCNSLEVAPDMRLICSGHFDKMVRFWDAKTGECVKEISDAHSGQVTSVQYSTDGQYILSASRDNTLKIIDVRTFETVQTFSHEGYNSGANWNRCSLSFGDDYVAAGGSDGKIFVWNAKTGKLETALKGASEATGEKMCVYSASWNVTGPELATADKGGFITIWV